MSGWMIVAIVAIVMSGIVKIYTMRRDERLGVIRDDDDRIVSRHDTVAGAGEREARREVEDLRERIKVLERIATDGNSLDASETRRIAREIEALRDRQDG